MKFVMRCGCWPPIPKPRQSLALLWQSLRFSSIAMSYRELRSTLPYLAEETSTRPCSRRLDHESKTSPVDHLCVDCFGLRCRARQVGASRKFISLARSKFREIG